MQDKRKTVLHLFHESAKPWLLKDVEKAAAKRGVVFQAVKDVVQSLIDDSLVHVDKIGTSNWYWSFPGEASAKLRHEVGSMDAQIAAVEAECAQLDERLEKAAAEFPQTEERQMAERQVNTQCCNGCCYKFGHALVRHPAPPPREGV